MKNITCPSCEGNVSKRCSCGKYMEWQSFKCVSEGYTECAGYWKCKCGNKGAMAGYVDTYIDMIGGKEGRC